MKIEAIIFDLDGTLFDTIEDISDANNAMLKGFGYPGHEVEKYIQWIGNGALKLVKASLPNYAQFDEASLLNYLAFFQKIYADNIILKSKLYQGIEGVLDFLAHELIPIAINTNKPQQHTDLIVERCFEKWKFSNVIGQQHDLPKKPDPTGALHIAQGMNVKPEYILFIGDSMVDIITAKNAGMIPLGVTWGYGNAVNGITMDGVVIINSPQQIIDFVKTNRNDNEE